MKENIKKLTVFVMIVAMAMFIAVAIASAQVSKRNTIYGEYAMMASGTCLYSSGGFNLNYTPIGSSWAVSNMATGIWTFHHDGKGTVQGTQFALTLPPPSPPYASPSAAEVVFSFDFTYTVTDDGAITVDMPFGTYSATFVKGPLTGAMHTYDTPNTTSVRLLGMVSVDHKTITLANENDYQVSKIILPSGSSLPPVSSVCNIARVLIRLGEIERSRGRD